MKIKPKTSYFDFPICMRNDLFVKKGHIDLIKYINSLWEETGKGRRKQEVKTANKDKKQEE